MKKIVKTALPLIFATAILLTQASVFAVTLTDSPQKIPVSDVIVMAEDVSKRGEFEKHYICSDGTFVVASYAEAIHYKNENGEWVDVDNEISYNNLTQNYRAGNQTFSAEFASISDTSKLVKWPILDDYSIYYYEQAAFTDAFVDYLLIQRSNE